jgi:hypothetical protein
METRNRPLLGVGDRLRAHYHCNSCFLYYVLIVIGEQLIKCVYCYRSYIICPIALHLKAFCSTASKWCQWVLYWVINYFDDSLVFSIVPRIP